MTALAVFGFVLLVAYAVWNRTEQRPGTLDELRTFVAVIVALLIVAGLSILGALPAKAHTVPEIEAWERTWHARWDLTHARAAEDGGLSLVDVAELIAERVDFEGRHPWYYDPDWTPPTIRGGAHRGTPAAVPSSVEPWRPLVSAYFRPGDVNRALCLMGYESGGNPNAKNPRSTAAGLFQFLRSTWDQIVPASITGGSYASGRVYDPEANIAAAAWLRDAVGWSSWSPYQRGLCH